MKKGETKRRTKGSRRNGKREEREQREERLYRFLGFYEEDGRKKENIVQGTRAKEGKGRERPREKQGA